ncbi:nicotinate phosphoribosyltransferase [Rhodoblastus sp. 17X3]|uniref:nicotinate phosphoribosyltransferase n=1 Tax=Rhodoblastus sp. 17X3 TaxID=3047026 RepID=UPI0024B84D6B|nr:nicotinate phosphoribosyltransferase [Rhodoblastus sp. 17X3]MDI9847439.1 nicotinate phosphoribosyltransferase [Rhodoblastus sp. 17X3]
MDFDGSEAATAGSGLFADLYELTMLRAFGECGMTEEAVFSLFVRNMPADRNLLIACGLDDVLAEIERFRFSRGDIDYLRSLGMFSREFLDGMREFRFRGDVYAMAEGTPFFPDEPILEVAAPIGQGQILETLILNQIGLQSILASKAHRVVAAASGRQVMDFGARRAQGFDAALKGARAFAIAGVGGTSLLAAGERYGIPVTGTMAHSFVEAFASEAEALAAMMRIYPRTVLLVDTYDSLQGVRNVVALAKSLGSDCRLTGVRLDSGDLDALSRGARSILDDAGLGRLKIIASGGLTEFRIDALVRAGAPIDIFGVGTDMSVSGDAPSLDIVYKLTEYAGAGRMKLSSLKSTMPGRKQVFRQEVDGVAVRDVLASADESCAGTPLLQPVMRRGARLSPPAASLSAVRDQAMRLIGKMPPEFRAFAAAGRAYPVVVSDRLREKTQALRDSLLSGKAAS